LLLALQLVLQPLGSIAWCAAASMGFGEGCCCASSEQVDAAPSCCSQEPVRESDPSPGSPCGCSVTPEPVAAVLPTSVAFDSPVLVSAQLDGLANLTPPAASELATPRSRARAPGGGAPLHLLLQVFRL